MRQLLYISKWKTAFYIYVIVDFAYGSAELPGVMSNSKFLIAATWCLSVLCTGTTGNTIWMILVLTLSFNSSGLLAYKGWMLDHVQKEFLYGRNECLDRVPPSDSWCHRRAPDRTPPGLCRPCLERGRALGADMGDVGRPRATFPVFTRAAPQPTTSRPLGRRAYKTTRFADPHTLAS